MLFFNDRCMGKPLTRGPKWKRPSLHRDSGSIVNQTGCCCFGNSVSFSFPSILVEIYILKIRIDTESNNVRIAVAVDFFPPHPYNIITLIPIFSFIAQWFQL